MRKLRVKSGDLPRTMQLAALSQSWNLKPCSLNLTWVLTPVPEWLTVFASLMCADDCHVLCCGAVFGSLELWECLSPFLRGSLIPAFLPDRCGNPAPFHLALFPCSSGWAAAACSAPSRALWWSGLCWARGCKGSGLLRGTHLRRDAPPISPCDSAGVSVQLWGHAGVSDIHLWKAYMVDAQEGRKEGCLDLNT